jgi:hypothetical protein
VRAEHPSVDVTLVDHDVLQGSQERSPSWVSGQQRVMNEIGVGQDVLAMVADPAAFVRRGVTVVGCSPQPWDGQSRQARQLVGGQSLGWAQIERSGAPTRWGGRTIDDGGKHRQEVAEALAGRSAGGDDDMGAAMGAVRSFALMGPQCGDTGGAEGGRDGWGDPVGPWRRLFTAGWHLVDVYEPFRAPSAGQTGESLRWVEGPPGRRMRFAGHRIDRMPPVAPRV